MFGGFFWLLWCSLSLYLYMCFLLGIGILVISFFLQWDDSIENLPQQSLPRRKKRKWTSLEEETLRAGVRMYVFFFKTSQTIDFLVSYHGCKLYLKWKVNELVASFIYYDFMFHSLYFLCRFGEGNWRTILDFYSTIFEYRNGVCNLCTKDCYFFLNLCC